MLDMGPYYLTALVNWIGPAVRVCGSARSTFPTRTITSEPLDGTVVNVEVPTHYAGTIDFANGAVATVITSFDVWKANLPLLEVHGTEGSLSLPDPNRFAGPVRIARGRDDWEEVPLTHTEQISRGAGVADMAYGILHGRGHRASGQLACHVLEVMTAIERAGDEGRYVELATPCEQPAALPPGLAPGELDT
jgi:predicted dehydrogenase